MNYRHIRDDLILVLLAPIWVTAILLFVTVQVAPLFGAAAVGLWEAAKGRYVR